MTVDLSVLYFSCVFQANNAADVQDDQSPRNSSGDVQDDQTQDLSPVSGTSSGQRQAADVRPDLIDPEVVHTSDLRAIWLYCS